MVLELVDRHIDKKIKPPKQISKLNSYHTQKLTWNVS